MRRTAVVALVIFPFMASWAPAQTPKPSPSVSLKMTRSTSASAYKSGERTTVDFRGTPRMLHAGGTATIVSERALSRVSATFANLEPPSTLGPYAAYVLWQVTEHGYARNLAEVIVDGRRGRAAATVSSTAFALIVTAEPYFAVTVPSDAVILETLARGGAEDEGVRSVATYELFQQGHYDWLQPSASGAGGPVAAEIQQLRYALEIARSGGAEKSAASAWAKAQELASRAETLAASAKRGERDAAPSAAREAIRAAEEARAAAALQEAGAAG